MKKKWTIISIIVGLLVMSIGVFVAVAKSRTLEVSTEVKNIIDGEHRFLRHQFMNGEMKLFHENDSQQFRDGLWSSIKVELGSNTETIISKITDEQLKTDLTRAVYLWKYAVENKNEKALAYSYMIFADLDVQINHFESDLFRVTELQGDKEQKYNEMMNYIESIKNK